MNKPKGSSAAHSKLVNNTILEYQNENTRLWKNHTGMALDIDSTKNILHKFGILTLLKNIRKIKFGLVGSADIQGITKIKITQEMVGQEIGVFTAYECKTGKARQSESQKNFEKMVKSLGGIYKVIRN